MVQPSFALLSVGVRIHAQTDASGAMVAMLPVFFRILVEMHIREAVLGALMCTYLSALLASLTSNVASKP